MRPQQGHYPESVTFYFDRISGTGSLPDLLRQQAEQIAALAHLPADTWAYRYAPGKWTVQDLITHVTDWERIFGYRTLIYARGWPVAQPPVDENVLDQHHPQGRPPHHLLAEFAALRQANVLLAESLSPAQLQLRSPHGAPDYHYTLEGHLLLLVGHAAHHLGILHERYGLAIPG